MNDISSKIQTGVDKRVVLVIVAITSFLPTFMSSSINVALPSIGKEFSMDAVLLTWVPTSYLLAATVFMLPFGRLSDLYGRKKFYIYGITVYTVSSLITVFSASDVMLLVFRVLQGIGASMIFGNGVAILTSIYPAQERGRVLGASVAAVYIGLSVGPVLGGFMTEHLGWRSIFLANVPLGLLSVILLMWKLKSEWAEAKGERFDLAGSFIYGIALVAVMYGLSLLPDLPGGIVILAGFVCFGIFIWLETRTRYPVLNLDFFSRNKIFAFSNYAALINYSATFAVSFLLSLYLQYTKGLSVQIAGLVLLSSPVLQAIFSPIAGRLSDKIKPQFLASGGMALTTIGLIMLSMAGANTAIIYIVFSLVVLGLGFAFFSSPNMNAIMSSVEKKSYGVASAMSLSMRQIGMMLSMGISMLIFAIFIGRVEITPEYYPAFTTSVKLGFLISAVLCFGGIFASMVGWKIKSSGELH